MGLYFHFHYIFEQFKPDIRIIFPIVPHRFRVFIIYVGIWNFEHSRLISFFQLVIHLYKLEQDLQLTRQLQQVLVLHLVLALLVVLYLPILESLQIIFKFLLMIPFLLELIVKCVIFTYPL